MSIPITVVGNLTADPELRFTANGAAVASFTIAVNLRRFDKDQNAYVDAGTLFYRCSAWRDLAEHVSESLTRGSRVVAVLKPRPNEYETKEGEKRTTTEHDVDAIGPDLRYATAKVNKTQRSGGGNSFNQGGGQGGGFGQQHGTPSGGGWGQSGGAQPAFGGSPTDDPWATQNQGSAAESPF